MIATVNSLAAKLPPSVRDYDIYRFVKFECHSTRAAAREFGLSQTRIRQIVSHVREYLVESVPQTAGKDEPDTRLVVAEQLAREQLDWLYGRAVRGFNETEREDIHGNLLPGKASFLLAAARITLWMAKVPVHALPAFREDEETAEEAAQNRAKGAEPSDPSLKAEWEAFQRAEARAAAIRQALEAGKASTIPLDGECSDSALSSGHAAAETHPILDVNRVEKELYGKDGSEADGPNGIELPTAQQVALLPRSVPLMSGQIAAQRPLNRRERRAREKLRKRLLAKR